MEPPRSFPWAEIEDLRAFDSDEWTARIVTGLSVYRSGQRNPDPERRQQVIVVLQAHAHHALDRVKRLYAALTSMFVEKDEIIRMMIVCAIAHQPMLLVGKPGTAKSRLVLKLCEGLGLGRSGDQGARHTVFEYLLHGFTEPDEVLGPVDIAKLQGSHPSFERLRTGSLVEADVIFLDEVFRANSTILNALLSIMNERHIYEGGHIVRARARIVYGATNTVPVGRQLEELRAFYERFIIRVESELIPTEGPEGPSKSRQRLLKEGWAAEVRDLRRWDGSGIGKMKQAACLNDILFLNRAIAELWGGEDLDHTGDFVRDYHALVGVLAHEEVPKCDIDDRKFIRLITVLRAHSLFEHFGPPDRRDLAILQHVWSEPEMRADLAETVDRFLKESARAARRPA